MSVNELIFSQNKYVRVTNGNQVLIGIGPKTSIYVSDPHGETVEKHTPCLAWATSVNGNETFKGGQSTLLQDQFICRHCLQNY